MPYTEKFGGSAIEPAYVSFRAVALSASITTMWPSFATVGNQLARIMKVAASAASLTISLPDATLSGVGQDVIFDNAGANTFTVLDFAGNSIATLTAGQVKYLYLSDTSTSAGTWRVTLFGASASNLDASQLAGNGLMAIGATLNQSCPATTITTATTFTTSDRAKLYVNAGGSISCTLPLTSTVGNNWFMQLRNQGTGTMTIAGSGGETVDASASMVLQLNESCVLVAGTGAWYSVGRGRNQQFNFTQLTKAVTGGTTTLTLTEAANVVQTYTGVLLSSQIIVVPAVVQVYYIGNNTTGAYSFSIQTPTPGATLSIASGQSAVVFCDGTNVINASTSVGGITALLLAAGSAASPSMALVNTNNGFFAPTGTSVGVSTAGTEVARWVAGQELIVDGSAALPSYGFTTSPTTGFYRAAANQIGVSANGVSVGVFSSAGWSGAVTGGASGAIVATTLSASGAVSGAGFSNYFASPPAIGGTAAAAGSFTTLAASSTVSGAGFTAYLASPPAIGGTLAAAGSFTTLSASSTVSGAGMDAYLVSGKPGSFSSLAATGSVTLGTTAAAQRTILNASTAAGAGAIIQGQINSIDKFIIGSKNAAYGGTSNDLLLRSVSDNVVIDAASTTSATFSSTGVTIPGSLGVTGSADFYRTTGYTAGAGLQLGTAAKATPGGGGQGLIQIYSADATNQLQGQMSLTTSATASSRGLEITCIEQGVAYRDVRINTGGGSVVVGNTGGTVTIPGTLGVTGNTAFGTTPLATLAGQEIVAFGPNSNVMAESTLGVGGSFSQSQNASFASGAWLRISADAVSNYYQNIGTHIWRYAASGAAGSAITWSTGMSISNAGAVTIPGSLGVNGAVTFSTAGAVHTTTLGDGSASSGSALVMRGSSTERAWKMYTLSSGAFASPVLAITPSTTNGGTTFTSPFFELNGPNGSIDTFAVQSWWSGYGGTNDARMLVQATTTMLSLCGQGSTNSTRIVHDTTAKAMTLSTASSAAAVKNVLVANADTFAIDLGNASATISALGIFKPVQATTAGAPAYVKGAMYFDTTLNKLRVGGASAWESVTSV